MRKSYGMSKLLLALKSFTTKSLVLATLKKRFGNIVGKGENTGDQHFLLFQQCFQFLQTQN